MVHFWEMEHIKINGRLWKPDANCKRSPRLSSFLFAPGRRLLHLLLRHSAAEPGGNHPGEEPVGPAKLSLQGERCATADPREEMVGECLCGEEMLESCYGDACW